MPLLDLLRDPSPDTMLALSPTDFLAAVVILLFCISMLGGLILWLRTYDHQRPRSLARLSSWRRRLNLSGLAFLVLIGVFFGIGLLQA